MKVCGVEDITGASGAPNLGSIPSRPAIEFFLLNFYKFRLQIFEKDMGSNFYSVSYLTSFALYSVVSISFLANHLKFFGIYSYLRAKNIIRE